MEPPLVDLLLRLMNGAVGPQLLETSQCGCKVMDCVDPVEQHVISEQREKWLLYDDDLIFCWRPDNNDYEPYFKTA
jgi:hypothetical protein